MSYIDLKISDQEAGANNVQSAPNVLIKTPQENKAVFDALPDIVRQRFNSLIDELTQGGYLPLQGQEDLIIRINSTNGKMEFSLDAGQTWQASANEGHRILTSDGTVMPQRSDLRFEGANVRTEENQTIVNFQSGAQGIPEGGTTGQILRKNSNESYDANWKDSASDSERLGGVLASDFMRFSSFGDPDSPDSVLKASNATDHINKSTGAHTPESVGALPIAGGQMLGNISFSDENYLSTNVDGAFYFGRDRNQTGRGVTYSMEAGERLFLRTTGYVDCVRSTDVSVWMPARASAFTPMSSIKFKKNVQSLQIEKAKNLLKLRPVEYELKEPQEAVIDDEKTIKLTSDVEYGFIAEEVSEIDESFVFKNLAGEIESLNYMGMIAPLYTLVADLYTQIEELNKKLEAQHDTI